MRLDQGKRRDLVATGAVSLARTLIVMALAFLSEAAVAQSTICAGGRVPLDTSLGTPFVHMRLGGHEGNFSIDTGASYSVIDSETFGVPPKTKARLAGSSLPTVDSGTFTSLDMRHSPAPAGHLAGIIGTDFLSRRIVEFHNNLTEPYMVISAQRCSPKRLESAGLVPVSQDGYYSSDSRRLRPGTWPIPIIYLRIGSIVAPAEIDSGMRNAEIKRSVIFINQAFLEALEHAGISMRQDGFLNNVDCTGTHLTSELWQLESDPLAFATREGRPLIQYGPPLLSVIPPTTCENLARKSEPFARIGALQLQRWGVTVFDGFDDKIWINRALASSPVPLYRAIALAVNDFVGWKVIFGNSAEEAQASAHSACNQEYGNCRIVETVPATAFGCLALAANQQDAAKTSWAFRTSFHDAETSAVQACTEQRGGVCKLSSHVCND